MQAVRKLSRKNRLLRSQKRRRKYKCLLCEDQKVHITRSLSGAVHIRPCERCFKSMTPRKQ